MKNHNKSTVALISIFAVIVLGFCIFYSGNITERSSDVRAGNRVTSIQQLLVELKQDIKNLTNMVTNSADLSGYVRITGGDIYGSLNITNVISARQGAIGPDIENINLGRGESNLGVGHHHKFFGKEAFSVHDGNILGAKGFYWKAIDTTEHKIYLTMEQSIGDTNCLPITTVVSGAGGYCSTHPEYDIPYFGPKINSVHQELFTSEPLDIQITSISNKFITLLNPTGDTFTRCWKVIGVEDGSVILYEDVGVIKTNLYQTIYKKRVSSGDEIPEYGNHHYLVFFPEVPDVECATNVHVVNTSFGDVALGDGNVVIGRDALGVGIKNRAEGNYTIAGGDSSEARRTLSIALGDHAIADAPKTFVWSGNGVYEVPTTRPGTFNINPKGGLSGFWIGNVTLQSRLNDNLNASKTYTDLVSQFALAAVEAMTNKVAEAGAAKALEAVPDAIVDVLSPDSLEAPLSPDTPEYNLYPKNNRVNTLDFIIATNYVSSTNCNAEISLWPQPGKLRNFDIYIDTFPSNMLGQLLSVSFKYIKENDNYRIFADPPLEQRCNYDGTLMNDFYCWNITTNDIPCLITVREPRLGTLIIKKEFFSE